MRKLRHFAMLEVQCNYFILHSLIPAKSLTNAQGSKIVYGEKNQIMKNLLLLFFILKVSSSQSLAQQSTDSCFILKKEELIGIWQRNDI